MHLKSLVVMAAGLAAFASANPLGDSTTLTASLSADDLLSMDDLLPPEERPVETTDPYLKGCREIDLR
ncbi:hypothetical protein C0993_009334, partial [Termitomyces sp. T159_Od127]